MTRCEIWWLRGRTIEMQDEVAKRITNIICDVTKEKPEKVIVIFRETNPASYYTAGTSETYKRSNKKAE